MLFKIEITFTNNTCSTPQEMKVVMKRLENIVGLEKKKKKAIYSAYLSFPTMFSKVCLLKDLCEHRDFHGKGCHPNFSSMSATS